MFFRIVDDTRANNFSGLSSNIHGFDAASATALNFVFIDERPLAQSVFRHDQEFEHFFIDESRLHHAHADNGVM